MADAGILQNMHCWRNSALCVLKEESLWEEISGTGTGTRLLTSWPAGKEVIDTQEARIRGAYITGGSNVLGDCEAIKGCKRRVGNLKFKESIEQGNR